MKLSAILEPMIAAGVPGSVILDTVRAYEEQAGAALEEGKEKARQRWRRWKNNLNLSATEWRDLSHAVKVRDGFACVYCGSVEEPLHCDHIKPLCQGGTNDIDNLVTACRSCNCGKSGSTVEQWRARA